MKELDDEQIQQLAEQCTDPNNDSLPDGEVGEVKAYQLLFKSLEQVPPGGLPYQFAAKAAAHLRRQINRKNDIRFYMGSLLVFTLGFTTAVGLLYLANPQAGQLFLEMLNRFKWMILMASLLFLTIQYTDQKKLKEI